MDLLTDPHPPVSLIPIFQVIQEMGCRRGQFVSVTHDRTDVAISRDIEGFDLGPVRYPAQYPLSGSSNSVRQIM